MLLRFSPAAGRGAVADAVGINCEKGAKLKIKAQVSSLCAKGCIFYV